MEAINNITKNVLTSLYQSFGFALLIACLYMFYILYSQEHGYKEALHKWKQCFCESSSFRRKFILAIYSAMILFRTLFNRGIWVNPLSDIFGGWTMYNSKGEFTTENIENVMLFVPFTALLLWERDLFRRSNGNFRLIVWKSFKFTLLFSVAIEFTQLFLKLGTFQFSDICFNTLGGVTGGGIFWLFELVNMKMDSNKGVS